MLRVIFVGDVVGEPGLAYLERHLAGLRRRWRADLVVANGENLDLTDHPGSPGQCGMLMSSLLRLLASGVDAVTGGNHSWDGPEVEQVLEHPQVLRPLNGSGPGRGQMVLQHENWRLHLVNWLGQSAGGEGNFDLQAKPGQVHLLDFHAESVYEKLRLAARLDGSWQALVGTHTHLPSPDCQVLPGGLAYVSDVGMTGPSGGAQGYAWNSLRGADLSLAPGAVELGAVLLTFTHKGQEICRLEGPKDV
jgi:calcineurin-like phosphoesterase